MQSDATLSDAFVHAARTWPTCDCLTIWSSSDDEVVERLSFQAFLARAVGASSQLRNGFGVETGVYVCVLSAPVTGCFVCMAGIMLSGGVVVSGNYKLSPDRLAAAVVSTGASLVVTSAANVTLCAEAGRAFDLFGQIRTIRLDGPAAVSYTHLTLPTTPYV